MSNSKVIDCVNWHGLPCIHVSGQGKDVAAIFTNISNELVICEVPWVDINSAETYEQMLNVQGFNCLGRTAPVQDEFTLVLCLTERCNASCAYCFLDAQTSGLTMSEELLIKSIDFVRSRFSGRKVNIAAFGGEPTVAPQLLKLMVSYGKEKLADWCRFSITTNGYFSDNICDFLIENNFQISLSMDGVRVVQEKQRPCGVSIEQLERNILRLVKSKCELKIRCTVTQYSVNYMLDTVKYLSTLGVKRIHFEPVTPGGRAIVSGPLTLQPTVEKFCESLFAYIEYGAQHNIDVICFPYMNMQHAPVVFCDGNINNRLVVGASGILSTCVEVQNRKHPLFEALGIGYFDQKLKKFILEFERRRPFCRGCSELVRNNECKSCAFNFFCAGGCPTRNYRGSENTEIISNYRCAIMKKVMPYILEKYYKNTYDLK